MFELIVWFQRHLKGLESFLLRFSTQHALVANRTEKNNYIGVHFPHLLESIDHILHTYMQIYISICRCIYTVRLEHQHLQEDSEKEEDERYKVLTAQEQKKLRAALAEKNKSNAGKKSRSKRNKGKKTKKGNKTKVSETTKPQKAKGCMQLIPKDQQYKFRELLVKKKTICMSSLLS